MATVIHIRNAPARFAQMETFAYIGRARNGLDGKWGNPFPIGPKTTRQQSISQYRRWLWGQINAGQVSLTDLASLRYKTLVCYCKPQDCHGDVLAKAAEWAEAKLAEMEADL